MRKKKQKDVAIEFECERRNRDILKLNLSVPKKKEKDIANEFGNTRLYSLDNNEEEEQPLRRTGFIQDRIMQANRGSPRHNMGTMRISCWFALQT